MKTLRLRDQRDLAAFRRRLEAGRSAAPSDERKVKAIVDAVRRRGDPALLAYARRFDGFKGRVADLRVGAAELRSASRSLSPSLRRALLSAIANIRAYQQRLKPLSWRRHLRSGVMLGQLARPLDRVGVYVPGGQAPLVSSLLMTVVPAKVAGVREIAVCTPPSRSGAVDPRLLAAAELAGATEVYQVGGAQAVAAMAYGTRSIPAVQKVVGPGNRWVTLAKKLVYGAVGIDSLAGPSEALVVADESAPVAWVAADLLSQAEHAGDNAAVLVTTSPALAKAVGGELKRQLAQLPRRAQAARSLRDLGLVVLVKDLWMALEAAAAVAPEHLQLMVRGAEALLPKVRSAGAIFVGPYSPVSLGDFLAGPSHVLPTGGAARFSNGLSAEDFYTKSSIIGYERSSLRHALEDLRAISEAEGLQAHYRSAEVRLAGRAQAK